MKKYILLFLLSFGVFFQTAAQIKEFEIGATQGFTEPFFLVPGQGPTFINIKNFKWSKNQFYEGYIPIRYTFEKTNQTITTQINTYNQSSINTTINLPVNFNFTIPSPIIDQIQVTGSASFQVLGGELFRFGVTDWVANDGDHAGTVRFRIRYVNPAGSGVPSPTPQIFTFTLLGKANPIPATTTTVHWSPFVPVNGPGGVVSSISKQRKVNSGPWQNIGLSNSVETFPSNTTVRYRLIYTVSPGSGNFATGTIKAGATSGASNYAIQGATGFPGQTRTLEISVNTSGKAHIYFTGNILANVFN